MLLSIFDSLGPVDYAALYFCQWNIFGMQFLYGKKKSVKNLFDSGGRDVALGHRACGTCWATSDRECHSFKKGLFANGICFIHSSAH